MTPVAPLRPLDPAIPALAQMPPEWAATCAQLFARLSPRVVCLEFPITPAPGSPWVRVTRDGQLWASWVTLPPTTPLPRLTGRDWLVVLVLLSRGFGIVPVAFERHCQALLVASALGLAVAAIGPAPLGAARAPLLATCRGGVVLSLGGLLAALTMDVRALRRDLRRTGFRVPVAPAPAVWPQLRAALSGAARAGAT